MADEGLPSRSSTSPSPQLISQLVGVGLVSLDCRLSVYSVPSFADGAPDMFDASMASVCFWEGKTSWKPVLSAVGKENSRDSTIPFRLTNQL